MKKFEGLTEEEWVAIAVQIPNGDDTVALKEIKRIFHEPVAQHGRATDF